MVHRQMQFLNLEGFVFRHADIDVSKTASLDFTATVSEQRNRLYALDLRHFQGINHVGAVAGSGDSEQYIALIPHAQKLLGKGQIRCLVIGKGGIECHLVDH